jgi:hypothetical protein
MEITQKMVQHDTAETGQTKDRCVCGQTKQAG